MAPQEGLVEYNLTPLMTDMVYTQPCSMIRFSPSDDVSLASEHKKENMTAKTQGGRDEMGEIALRRSLDGLNARMNSSHDLISGSMARCQHSRQFAWLGFIEKQNETCHDLGLNDDTSRPFSQGHRLFLDHLYILFVAAYINRGCGNTVRIKRGYRDFLSSVREENYRGDRGSRASARSMLGSPKSAQD